MNELKTKKNAALIANDWGSRNHVHTLVLMAVTEQSLSDLAAERIVGRVLLEIDGEPASAAHVEP